MVFSGDEIEVVVVGGGPAGMSCAAWCLELGVQAVLVEASECFGGQLNRVYNPITNYLGVDAVSGSDLAERMISGSISRGVKALGNTSVVAINAVEPIVTLASGEELRPRFIVLATGVRRRQLGLAGEQELRGKGILESGSKEKEAVLDRRVAIIGGGDAALENAIILAEYAKDVFVIHRRRKFSARQEFLVKAAAFPNINVLTPLELSAITGRSALEALELRDRVTGESRMLEVDHLLIRIGVEPNSQLAIGQLRTDAAGYIQIDPDGQTSSETVFAVGDVAHPVSPTIATAVGSGAAAAKAIAHRIAGGKRT